MDKHNSEVYAVVPVLDKGPSAETIYRRHESPLWMSQLQTEKKESAQKCTIIVRIPQLLYWNATRLAVMCVNV
jgi:hypothetical protein